MLYITYSNGVSRSCCTPLAFFACSATSFPCSPSSSELSLPPSSREMRRSPFRSHLPVILGLLRRCCNSRAPSSASPRPIIKATSSPRNGVAVPSTPSLRSTGDSSPCCAMLPAFPTYTLVPTLPVTPFALPLSSMLFFPSLSLHTCFSPTVRLGPQELNVAIDKKWTVGICPMMLAPLRALPCVPFVSQSPDSGPTAPSFLKTFLTHATNFVTCKKCASSTCCLSADLVIGPTAFCQMWW